MSLPIILRVFKEGHLFEVKQFSSDQVVIGNQAEVDLDLRDASVSPIHALIEKRETDFYLCDLGSSSGTYKNGKQILDDKIESGDEFELGIFKIAFYVGVPKPKGQAPREFRTPAQVSIAESDDRSQPKVPAVVRPIVSKVPEAVAQPKVPKAPPRPEIATKGGPVVKVKGTFAPPSFTQDLTQIVKPGRGSWIEVVVCWKERIIETYHPIGVKSIIMGSSEKATIPLPATVFQGVHRLVDMSAGVATIFIRPDMNGEVYREHETLYFSDLEQKGRISKRSQANVLVLEQGEVIRLSLPNADINIYVRYKNPTPKMTPVPLIPISNSTLIGLFSTIGLVLLLYLYIAINTLPPGSDKKKEDDLLRLAQVVFQKPIPPPAHPIEKILEPPKPVAPPPVKPPEPPKVKVVEGEKTKAPVLNKTPDKQAAPVKVNHTAAGPKGGGKAPDLRPNNNTHRPKIFSSSKQGGAIKTGETNGANAKSRKQDPNKLGLFSAFGGGGARSKLDESYSGSGELLGMAKNATGTSGFNKNRPGEDLGSAFKDTGAGGKGTATEGISGGVTKGRGSGMAGYGNEGSGLGDKSGVEIMVGGGGESFTGTIDREAVRRVVQSQKPAVTRCYDKALMDNPKLSGRIVFTWQIGDRGRVDWIKVKSSTVSDRSVEDCILNVYKSVRFPEPPRGSVAEIDFPFVLQK